MKTTKYLPVLTLLLCIPGVIFRTAHIAYGFDSNTGLPLRGNVWFWLCIGLFVVSGALFAVCAAPLNSLRETPFEDILGTKSTLFRLAVAVGGLLTIVGGGLYLYYAATVEDLEVTPWAHVLEFVYAGLTILTGVTCIAMARMQGRKPTAQSARLTLVPLLWSCLHLLITYRLTCVDPKLPSFVFGLVGDILIVLACYQFARMLYSKPCPAALAVTQAVTVLVCVSDLGGYGIAHLLGAPTLEWSIKNLVRDGISVALCILLVSELWVLSTQARPKVAQHAK